MRELLALVLTGVALALVGLVVRSRRGARALPPPPVLAEDSSEATASTPPSSDGARSVARAGTPREQRILEINERSYTGMCLYCEKHASRQIPQLKLIRSTFDRIQLRVNLVPINRWAIELHPDVSIPHLLCEQHHAIARSHLERRIAENQVDYASFVERQRHEMYEYVTFGLDERMAADVNVIKRGRRPKAAAPEVSNNVRSIATAKKEAAAS